MKARPISQKRETVPKHHPMQQKEERGRAERIDLSRLHRLREMKDFTGKFLGTQLPTALECSDVTELAFRRAGALLEYCGDAAEFAPEAGTRTEAIEGWVLDSVKLQLEMIYAANQRLHEIHARAVACGPKE